MNTNPVKEAEKTEKIQETPVTFFHRPKAGEEPYRSRPVPSAPENIRGPQPGSWVDGYSSESGGRLCIKCQKELDGLDRGLHKKMINRGSTEFFCIDCLGDYIGVSRRELLRKAKQFHDAGCTLFPELPDFPELEEENQKQ